MKLIKYLLNLALCLALVSNIAWAESKFHIGVMVCLSGECAEAGNNSLKGIRLAVDEINNAGGVLGQKIELVIEDTQESTGAKVAVAAFQKLTMQPDIKFFIGPSWTPAGLALAPLLAKRPELIATSPSLGVGDYHKAGPNIFNVWPQDEFATIALAQFALDSGMKKAAIFSSQQPWEQLQGASFERAFVKGGGVVTARREPQPTETDLRNEALKIVATKPEVVFMSNYNQLGIAAKQLRTVGYKGPILAILMDEGRIKIAGGALEDAIWSGYQPASSDFVARFTKVYGEAPGIAADTAYDVVRVYADAISRAKSFESTKVILELLATQLQGASGLIRFDQDGGVVKTPVLYRVENGKSNLYRKAS